MQTATTTNLPETVDIINQAAEYAVTHESVEAFEAFEKQLNELQTLVRELQQAMWKTEARAVIKHLEANEPLTTTDTEVIRTFLISDAEHYLAHENNYEEWLGELRRLMADIARRAGDVKRNTVGDLRGVLKDATRLVPAIRNYLEEKQRVERFQTAMQTVDDTYRNLLIKILAEQLESPKR
jgi:signal transduction histidine kinase